MRRTITLALFVAVLVLSLTGSAEAVPTVGLGTAKNFAILAGQGVTNTGASVVSGEVGTSPAPAVTGFPPGIIHGAVHRADAVALQAQNDLTTAYNDAAGRTGSAIPPQLGGQTLGPGVYNGGALNITGTLTLNGPGVYIFTASSSLTAATGSNVRLTNGANPCNVFWQVTSSAALDGPRFVGTVMALTSITVGNGVHVSGRLLARNGDVTLINDVVNSSACSGSGGTTTPVKHPKAKFLGPCGEPFYAARFNNHFSTVYVRFHWTFTSFLTGQPTTISRVVPAGQRFTTRFHHVLGSTLMKITRGRVGHRRLLAQIRSAPPGNYGPCP